MTRFMRVLVLGAGLVQLALYGAPAPATAAPSPVVLRATEEQRLSTPTPAQTAILSHPQIHPVKAAAPNPGPVPQVAGPVAPEATRMPFATRSAVAQPCEAARARLARAPPAA